MLLLRLVAGGRGRRDPAFAHKGSNPGACCCKMPGKADRSLGFCNTVVGPKVDLFVFDRTPNPLDEGVVAPGAFAVPADRNGVVPQQTGELDAGELGGFKWSSQHDVRWLTEATYQTPRQVFSTQASFGGGR